MSNTPLGYQEIYHCAVSLKQFELAVYLGVTEQERATTQNIFLDVTLYIHPPLGCITDNITDTFCYAELIQLINNEFSKKSFHLLEHLAYSLFKTLQQKLSSATKIHIVVHKMPPIANLKGGVTFSYSNFPVS